MNLEELMKEREFKNGIMSDMTVIASNPTNIRQKSTRSATLYDFIKMVDKLVELTIPGVKFIPDEGKVMSLDAMKEFNGPVITYSVVNRKTKKEIKPRVREVITEITDDTGTERLGEVWGQKFECLVQFNVFASVYNEAEQVMEKFEETIIKHAGFFKKNGVAELFFQEHLTDSHFDTLRESLSIRSLIYYVEIEKLTVMFKEKINEIEILAQNQINNKEEEN